MALFLGRAYELGLLNNLLTKESASLVTIKGRRRIGKSRLVEEFAAPYQFYNFSGVPPHEKTTNNSEQNVFLIQLIKYFKEVNVENIDWMTLFWFLAEKTKTGRVIILLNEISWMGTKDPDFMGKLKTVWDTNFKKTIN